MPVRAGKDRTASLRRYDNRAVLASFNATEFFGHSHACPGLCALASSGYFLASRQARRSLSRASRVSTLSSMHSCLRVTISMVGLGAADFVDHLANGVDDQPRLIEIDIVPTMRLGDMRGMERCRQRILSRPPLGKRDHFPPACLAVRRGWWRWPRLVGAQHDGRTVGQGRSPHDPPDGIHKLDRFGSRRRGHSVIRVPSRQFFVAGLLLDEFARACP
jgi:hypothetical protein